MIFQKKSSIQLANVCVVTADNGLHFKRKITSGAKICGFTQIVLLTRTVSLTRYDVKGTVLEFVFLFLRWIL